MGDRLETKLKPALSNAEKIKDIGLTGGLAKHVKDRQFTYSVSVKAKETITFKLTYDEKLERYNGSYKYQLFLKTQTVMDKLSVLINLEESLPVIKNITNPVCKKYKEKAKTAHFEWTPEKWDYASFMEQGVSVEYTVEEPKDEIQVMCGHFIHWFTPDKITRNKFVVFVLDVSGSMWGARIKQLQDVMKEIFKKMMSREDYFSIITFDHTVKRHKDLITSNDMLTNKGIYRGKDKNKALKFINKLEVNPDGWTNLNDALLQGIHAAEESKDLLKDKKLSHMVVFLTDGEATAGEENRDTIIIM